MATSSLNEVQILEHAIARPAPGSFTSVADAMGFGQRSAEFSEFTSGLRGLSSKYLNGKLNYREQNPDAWQQFFDEACKLFPFVTQYADAWPINAYMQSRLERTKYEYRISAKVKHRSRHQARMQPYTHTRNTSSCLESIQSGRVDKNNHSGLAVSPVTTNGNQIQSPVSGTQTHQSGTNSNLVSNFIMDNSQNTGTKLLGATQDVTEFLRTVHPNLENLTRMFLQAGVVDAECVQALAEMPDSEKNAFLRETLELNPFQVHAVRVALAKRIRVNI
ncbi:hypothetical protein BKA93DRAFT_775347 [Sparassis latifolia]